MNKYKKIFFLCAVTTTSHIILAKPLMSDKIKILSTSPDSQVEIYTIAPKGSILEEYTILEETRPHAKNRIVYNGIYLTDKRNKSGIRFNLNEEDATAIEADVTWALDSNSFTISYGDEAEWTDKFFVSRIDARTSIRIYEQPKLPNMLNVILKHTNEPNNLFIIPKPIEYDEGKFLNISNGWVSTNPIITKNGDENNPIEFKMTFFLTNTNGGVFERMWQYESVFETYDWIRYDLRKIIRSGKKSISVSDAKQSSIDTEILYSK